MHIAICSVGELFGGVERQILGLCDFLGEEQLGPDLVAPYHDAELARQLRARGVEPVILCGRHRYDPSTISQLTRDVQQVHYDLAARDNSYFEVYRGSPGASNGSRTDRISRYPVNLPLDLGRRKVGSG